MKVWVATNPSCESIDAPTLYWAGEGWLVAVVIAESEERAAQLTEVITSSEQTKGRGAFRRTNWRWECLGDSAETEERVVCLAYGAY